MQSTTVTDALRLVPLFAGLSDEQFASVERGSEVWLQPGEVLVREGDPPLGFFVQLEGQTEWTRRVGQQEVYVLTHGPGVFYGHELVLTDKPHPVTGRALTAVRLYKLEPDAFWEMLSVCPSILRSLVATLAERFQNLGEASQQHARLASLGTMAAGLAHELNNPAAAARRAVAGLRESFEESQSLAFKLQEGGLISSQCLAKIGREIQDRARTVPTLDTLEQSDREEEIAFWLEARGFEDDAWQIASALAASGLEVAWLDSLAARAPDDALRDLLPWVGASLTTRDLLDQVEGSTGRVSKLVKAVKEYSYMDQAPLQELDVHEGLESTLTMLGHRLRKGDIVVTREYEEYLPRVNAYGSELNQAWTNLIDNAIDALGGSGRIWVRTSQEPDRVLVEVADDGPGIPEEIEPRIFEPFFTTKGVGEGMGLGLDTARRIVVGRHGGDIRVDSRPGETAFVVRLPLDTPGDRRATT